MILFWRIRYLDSRDRQFKDRDLWLDTDALDAVSKAAVEAAYEMRRGRYERDILRHRHLFRTDTMSSEERNTLCERRCGMHAFCLTDYFEDENGTELALSQMAPILTGDPNVILFPPGAKQHDIDWALAEKPPIRLDTITLPEDKVVVLGYFTRDLRELTASAFHRDSSVTLDGANSDEPILGTPVTDEEIRSFVTIFRRLYMKTEPANFLGTANLFAEVLDGHPLAKWMRGAASEYQSHLARLLPFLGRYAAGAREASRNA